MPLGNHVILQRDLSVARYSPLRLGFRAEQDLATTLSGFFGVRCCYLREKLHLEAGTRSHPFMRGSLWPCLTKLPRNFWTEPRCKGVKFSDVSFWGSRLEKTGSSLGFCGIWSSYCSEARHGSASPRWCSRRQKARSWLEGLAPLLMVTGRSEGHMNRAQRETEGEVGQTLNGHFWFNGMRQGENDDLTLCPWETIRWSPSLSHSFIPFTLLGPCHCYLKGGGKESSNDRTRAQGEKKNQRKDR